MTSSRPQTMANLRQRLRVRSLSQRVDTGELGLGLNYNIGLYLCQIRLGDKMVINHGSEYYWEKVGGLI